MLINNHTQCRVCKGKLADILNLGNHYLHGSFVYPDFQPPVRKSPVVLTKCEHCHLVQLRHSIDPDILYARYGYRSSTNDTMKRHLADISCKAMLMLDLKQSPQRTVLDIGCNDGYLLRQYPSQYQKIGIDPCDIGCKIDDIPNFTFFNDLYPNTKTSYEINAYDIITMIACFYDVNDPVEVARNISFNLKKEGVACIEVSYWPEKMKSRAVDEICQEHVAFYSYQNLEYIFTQAGMKVVDVELNGINGGSIQLWLVRNENKTIPVNKQAIQKIKFAEFEMKLDEMETYAKFQQQCLKLYNQTQALFDKIAQEKKTVHLYGASTKGNVLLQYLQLDKNQIPYAAERSKEKFGGRTLGTDIYMISEADSRAMKPDYYFVPIWGFRKEIIEREKQYLADGGKLIFPLPELEIVSQHNTERL